jgi:hypothetical protein
MTNLDDLHDLHDLHDLIDRYIAIWNHNDAERRRNLVASTWAEAASYVDPVMSGEGQSGIDAMVRGVQERFPGYGLSRTSEIDSHHDRICFSWELAPEGGLPVVKGTDFCVVSADGRLQAISGFFEQAPL